MSLFDNNEPLLQWMPTAPAITPELREEAARCADETAKVERGERGRIRNPIDDGLLTEFSDAAFGTACEVALHIADALLARGQRFRSDLPWTTAATLLRAGWKRGDRMLAHVVGKEPAS